MFKDRKLLNPRSHAPEIAAATNACSIPAYFTLAHESNSDPNSRDENSWKENTINDTRDLFSDHDIVKRRLQRPR